MAEQSTNREHGAAGLTPTRLEVTTSLRAAELERIDEILETPPDALDRPDITGVPPAPQDALPQDWQQALDHAGLDDPDDAVEAPPASITSPEGVQLVKEHHPARWAGPCP